MTVRQRIEALWPIAFCAILVVLVTSLVTAFGALPLQQTLITGLVNLVIVVGLYIFVGNTGVLSFGHAAFLSVGGYATAILASPPALKMTLNSVPGFLRDGALDPSVALLLSAGLAALFGAVAAAPLMRLSGLSAGLATVSLLVIVRIVSQNWTGVTNGTGGVFGIPPIGSAWSVVPWAIGALVVAFTHQRSRIGLLARATREDEVAAASVGVQVARERTYAFVLSGAITGLGGGLFAQSVGALDPNAFFLGITFLMIVMLVAGGLQTLSGAVVGTLAISVVGELLSRQESGQLLHVGFLQRPGLHDLGLGIVMLAVLLLRPNGLVGSREVQLPRWLRRAPRRNEPTTAASTPKLHVPEQNIEETS